MSMSTGLASESEHDSPGGVPHPCFSPLFTFCSPFTIMLLFHLDLALWVPSRSLCPNRLPCLLINQWRRESRVDVSGYIQAGGIRIQMSSLLLLFCPHQAAPTRNRDSSHIAFQLTGKRTSPSCKGLFSKLHTPLAPTWPGLVTWLEEGWEMWTSYCVHEPNMTRDGGRTLSTEHSLPRGESGYS